MLGEILSVVTGGGATGIIGAVFSNVSDFFKQRSNQKHEHSMALLAAKERKEEMELQLQVTTTETEAEKAIAREHARAQESVAEANVMAASYNHDMARYATGAKAKNSVLFMIVDFIRGMVRPALTAYLAAVVTYTLFIVKDMMHTYCNNPEVQECVAILTQEQAYDIFDKIIATILYVFVTCVFWWFGTRSKVKAPQV